MFKYNGVKTKNKEDKNDIFDQNIWQIIKIKKNT